MNIIFIATRRRNFLAIKKKGDARNEPTSIISRNVRVDISARPCTRVSARQSLDDPDADNDDRAGDDDGRCTLSGWRRSRGMMMTIGGCHRRHSIRRDGVQRTLAYSRCQERRATFRHRFNCLRSNGSHSPSHSANSRARHSRGRKMDVRRCGTPLRFFQVDRPIETQVGGKRFEFASRSLCEFRRSWSADRKITDRHAKAATRRVFPPWGAH